MLGAKSFYHFCWSIFLARRLLKGLGTEPSQFQQVSEKVPEKVRKALVQSQIRPNRVPEKVPEKVLESLGLKPRFNGALCVGLAKPRSASVAGSGNTGPLSST
jgi:hypothetical protein